MSKQIDFICIGVQKGLSTWLDRCLRKHPQIQLPKSKELVFFTKKGEYGDKNPSYVNFGKPLSWYLKQFSNDDRIKGEVSTHYIVDPRAAKRIKKAFPEIKILAILRNPISRAYSHYVMEHDDRCTESRSFEDIVQGDKKNEILTRGLYFEQLKSYFNVFERKNIKIILVDDVKKNPVKTISEIFSFLEVDNTFVPESATKKVNKSTKAKNTFIRKLFFSSRRCIESLGGRKLIAYFTKIGLIKKLLAVENKYNRSEYSYKPLIESTKKELIEYYKKDIKNLEKLIDRDLSSWLV